MASERFKVLIGDIQPPEQKREYTKKEKAKNFWYYNKWYFIIGAVVLIMVISTIISIVTKVKPDYNFGVITSDQLPDTLITGLAKSLEKHVDDRNQDGKIRVQVNQYNLNYSEESSANEDPNIRMANVTRLMGDLQTCDSMVFFVDDIKGLQTADGFMGYNDGTFPAEGEETDFSKMGVKWSKSDVLSGLDIGKVELFGIENPEDYPDGQVFMQDFLMVLRAYDPSLKPESDNSKYFYDCFEIFRELSK